MQGAAGGAVDGLGQEGGACARAHEHIDENAVGGECQAVGGAVEMLKIRPCGPEALTGALATGTRTPALDFRSRAPGSRTMELIMGRGFGRGFGQGLRVRASAPSPVKPVPGRVRYYKDAFSIVSTQHIDFSKQFFLKKIVDQVTVFD